MGLLIAMILNGFTLTILKPTQGRFSGPCFTAISSDIMRQYESPYMPWVNYTRLKMKTYD